MVNVRCVLSKTEMKKKVEKCEWNGHLLQWYEQQFN